MLAVSGIRRRPTGYPRINRNAPFADKLVAAYLFGVTSGEMTPDLLGRTHLYHDFGLATQNAVSLFGVGVSSSGNPSFLSANPPPYVGAVAVGGMLTSTSTGIVLGQGQDNFAMAQFEWGIFVSSGTWRYGYGFVSSSGSSTTASLGRFDVGLSRNSTTGFGFVNGVQVNSNSSSGGTTSTNPIRGSTVSSGVPFGGVLDYALLFGCYVPDWVFMEIKRNPYQYFQPPMRLLGPGPASAPSSSFNSYLLNNWSGGYQDFTGGYIG